MLDSMDTSLVECVVENCKEIGNTPGTARGYCYAHYREFLASRGKQCSVSGCTGNAGVQGARNGLCSKHVYRKETHGSTHEDALVRSSPTSTLRERIARKVDMSSGCWVWQDKSASLMWEGKSASAKLLCWVEYGGTPPSRTQWVRLACKTTRCVNPQHMELVTKYHLQERTQLTDVERFHTKYTVNPVTDCWEWSQGIQKGTGYSQFSAKGRNLSGHRFSYSQFVGELIRGLVVDHLCEVRHCVNPVHLEQITQGENVRRSVFRPLDKRIVGIVYPY